MVAAMHGNAEPVAPGPWIAALGDYASQNTEAFREYGQLFAEQDIAALDKASHAALKRLQPLLHSRGTKGLVRRGHGDLHLGKHCADRW